MALCVVLDGSVLAPNFSSPESCPGHLMLTGSEYTAILDAQTNFGWNEEAFAYGFLGVLSMFAIGFGVGLIVNILRRARTL